MWKYNISEQSSTNAHNIEHFEKIIEKGRIPVTWYNGTHLFMFIFCLCGSIYAIYAMNFGSNPNPLNQPIDFLNVCFLILIAISIYAIFLFKRKIKVSFYKDTRSIELKKEAIERNAAKLNWKLSKSETNYYVYSDDSLLSYDVTVVFDDKGFYINSYPPFGQIIDFGKSNRRTEEIYQELRRH